MLNSGCGAVGRAVAPKQAIHGSNLVIGNFIYFQLYGKLYWNDRIKEAGKCPIFLKKVRNNENIIFLKNPRSKERITDIQSNMSTVVDVVVGCERGEGERKVNRFWEEVAARNGERIDWNDSRQAL